LIVGTVALRVLRILTATAGLATDVILLGKAPRSHIPQCHKLDFDLLNPVFDLLNR
jgi:hypothetical protein